jgi:hypothetical protein
MSKTNSSMSVIGTNWQRCLDSALVRRARRRMSPYFKRLLLANHRDGLCI